MGRSVSDSSSDSGQFARIDLAIRPLVSGDPGMLARIWNKPRETFEHDLAEQVVGQRAALTARVGGEYVGYVTLHWRSSYGPFRENGIPEIVDLNVARGCRRRGVGTHLLDAVERVAGERSAIVGIGVGMDADYGPAQRMYVRRGYVPDARGVTYRGRHPSHGVRTTVDAGLVLFMTKEL